MVLQAIVWTVLAWVAGLLLDANLSLQPAGFLCLRVLLPILAMGLCILREIRQNRDTSESSKAARGHCLRAAFLLAVCQRHESAELFA